LEGVKLLRYDLSRALSPLAAIDRANKLNESDSIPQQLLNCDLWKTI